MRVKQIAGPNQTKACPIRGFTKVVEFKVSIVTGIMRPCYLCE